MPCCILKAWQVQLLVPNLHKVDSGSSLCSCIWATDLVFAQYKSCDLTDSILCGRDFGPWCRLDAVSISIGNCFVLASCSGFKQPDSSNADTCGHDQKCVMLSRVMLMTCFAGSLALASVHSHQLVLAGLPQQATATKRLTSTWKILTMNVWAPSLRLAQHFRLPSVQMVSKEVSLQIFSKAGRILIHRSELAIRAAQ